MEEILKQWKEFKERPRVCICGASELEQGIYQVQTDGRIFLHKENCPMLDYLRTDVGVFLDHLNAIK